MEAAGGPLGATDPPTTSEHLWSSILFDWNLDKKSKKSSSSSSPDLLRLFLFSLPSVLLDAAEVDVVVCDGAAAFDVLRFFTSRNIQKKPILSKQECQHILVQGLQLY